MIPRRALGSAMPSEFWKGKVVVITGSSRGIGRVTAGALLGAGAQVMINGRDVARLEETRRTLAGDGDPPRLAAHASDVSRPEGAQSLVEQTVRTFGHLDVLINNAGLSMRGPFDELTPEVVRTIVEGNLYSAVFTTQAAGPHLRAARGRVLFVSSLAGVRGFPQVSIYSAAKMALAGLHQSLRAEWAGSGVSLGIVYLGFTENDADKTILRADGQPIHHERRAQMSQAEAAAALIEAVESGRRQTVLTASGKLLVMLQSHWPRLADWVVQRSGGRIHQVSARKE
jgi:NAD(P)-dependent dehydrogenase (short-subunit alcohol dehydrogenase family)